MAYYEDDYDYDIFGNDEETIALTKRGKPRKRKPKEPRIYFTQDTEDAIIEYLACTDQVERNRIYNDRIEYGFYKLAEQYFDHLNSINNRLISWPTRPDNIERWILKIYNEERFFTKFRKEIKKEITNLKS